jgi:hypothetical protein
MEAGSLMVNIDNTDAQVPSEYHRVSTSSRTPVPPAPDLFAAAVQGAEEH